MAATKNEAIDALVAAGDATRLAELAESKDREVAKAARRGLHLLRTRGVSVPAPRPAAAASSTPRPIGDAPEAWACVPDANGERLVVAIVPAAGGDFHVITAHVSDERGLVQLAYGKGPRKHARDVRRSFEESGGFAADVPIERATRIIESAYRLTLARGSSPPPDFAAARRVLPRVEARTGGEDAAELPAPAPAESFGREEAAVLHRLPTLARWIAPRAELMGLERKLDEIAGSRILVDERQRAAAWQDAIDAAITRVFEGDARRRWQDRLYESSLLFAAAGLSWEAQALRTQGDRLGDPAWDPLGDGFAREMVEKVTRGLAIPPGPGEASGPSGPSGPPAVGLIVPP